MLLPVFTTCVLLHDMVFWVLMAVPCTMVCYLVGMLFTHVHKKKEMKKKEIVCFTFIYSHDVRTVFSRLLWGL